MRTSLKLPQVDVARPVDYWRSVELEGSQRWAGDDRDREIIHSKREGKRERISPSRVLTKTEVINPRQRISPGPNHLSSYYLSQK